MVGDSIHSRWVELERLSPFQSKTFCDSTTAKYTIPCACHSSAIPLTSIFGSVIVTCSPLPTSRSPSQAVSIDAGLKSSKNKMKLDYFRAFQEPSNPRHALNIISTGDYYAMTFFAGVSPAVP